MKNFSLKNIVLSFLLMSFVLTSRVKADPPPPPPQHSQTDNQTGGGGAPLNGGLFVCLGLALAYGIWKYKINKELPEKRDQPG